MGSKHQYVDIDFNFFANPVSDDVSKKVDSNAIKQSLYNLIMMRRFDCPFHPEVNSQIYDSLFEIINPMTVGVIKRAITYTIQNFEPRVELISVDVSDSRRDENLVEITITYAVRSTGQTDSYSFTINRTR